MYIYALGGACSPAGACAGFPGCHVLNWEPTRYALLPSSSLDDTFRTIQRPPEVAVTVVP
eukprot:4255070-Pleurochrysis_carterae.AAC.1